MMPPSPQRILMTTDAVGGVWVYATGLARALCGRGFHVTLVVQGPSPSREQMAAVRGVRGLRVEITDLALEWTDPEGSDCKRAREVLLAIANRVRPNLIHLNSYREAAFDWPAPVLVVAHSCVTSWWHACRGVPPDDDRWHCYARAVVRGLDAADEWLAPTMAFRDLVEVIHQPRQSGTVIRNGTDVLPAVRGDEPFILAAGRVWDEAKNLASLAAIARRLDWPLRVAGPSDEPGSDRGTDLTAVECLGTLPRSQLINEMRRAGIFVAPALYEPAGLAVLEAAASGCALVLSKIPTFRELWGDAALYVNPACDNELFVALQTLSRDAPLRRRMQHAAAMRAQCYPLDATVQRYVEAYQRLAISQAIPAPMRSNLSLELGK